jgi:S1-C subfamily serine protease
VSLGDGVVATNRHVVEGADSLELTTWDGRDVEASVSAASYLNDLALIQTDAYSLPAPDPHIGRIANGDAVWAVGFPEGEQLTITTGSAVDYVDGRRFEESGPILRASVGIEHGSSGGPVLDERGKLIGVVFAREIATGLALVVPVTALATASEDEFGPVEGTCT